MIDARNPYVADMLAERNWTEDILTIRDMADGYDTVGEVKAVFPNTTAANPTLAKNRVLIAEYKVGVQEYMTWGYGVQGDEEGEFAHVIAVKNLAYTSATTLAFARGFFDGRVDLVITDANGNVYVTTHQLQSRNLRKNGATVGVAAKAETFVPTTKEERLGSPLRAISPVYAQTDDRMQVYWLPRVEPELTAVASQSSTRVVDDVFISLPITRVS